MRNTEHRADNGDALVWPAFVDSRKTAWTGAAGEIHEHGFELVIRMVAGRDVVNTVFFCDFSEALIACGACVVFCVARLILDVDGSLDVGAAETLSELADRFPIQVRYLRGAEVVDNVGDCWFGRDQGEDGGESHGIWSSGAGDKGFAGLIA